MEVDVVGREIGRGVDVALEDPDGRLSVLCIPVTDLKIRVGRVERAEGCHAPQPVYHLLPAATGDHHPPAIQPPLDPVIAVGDDVLPDDLGILAEGKVTKQQFWMREVVSGKLIWSTLL